MNNYKFTFAYPSNGEVSVPFMESKCNLIMYEAVSKERNLCLLGSTKEARSCHVPLNRNTICEFFLNNTTDDFLVMVDTDIEFKPTLLEDLNRLINEYEIVPNTNRSHYPHIISGRVDIANGLPVFFKGFGEGNYKQDPRPFKGLKHFDCVGTGIICISRYCLDTIRSEMPMEEKYHFFTHRAEGGKLSSDDFAFMFLARAHGFIPYGAWDIRGIHYKTLPIQPRYLETVEEFETYLKDNPDKVPDWLKE